MRSRTIAALAGDPRDPAGQRPRVTIILEAAPWTTNEQWEQLKRNQEEAARHATGNSSLSW